MADVDVLTGSRGNPCLLLTQAQVKVQTLESKNESSEKELVPKRSTTMAESADMADAGGLTGSDLTQAQVSAQTLDLSMKIPHAMDQPIHACL